MEMALIEIFCSYHAIKMWKDAFLLTGNFRHYIEVKKLTFLVNRVSEPLVRSKMVITYELKLCLSNFSRGIEKQKGLQGTNIEFSCVQLIYF